MGGFPSTGSGSLPTDAAPPGAYPGHTIREPGPPSAEVDGGPVPGETLIPGPEASMEAREIMTAEPETVVGVPDEISEPARDRTPVPEGT